MRRISFDVEGDTVIGHLYLPEGSGRHPAVIVGGPMTSVKEQVTGTYAAEFAHCGVATLAIDHRHYGESGGEPRQYEYYVDKIADLRAGLDVLAHQDEIDPQRLGAVGVCLGAGYMAAAVVGRSDIKAFIGIAGYYRDTTAMQVKDATGFHQKIEQGRASRERYEATSEVEMIPAVALEGDAAMTLQSTFDYYTVRAAHPNYRNEFAVMSREPFVQFDVQSIAVRIDVPFLMMHGPNALNPDWATKFFRAVRGEKERVEIVSNGQTDIYDDPAIVSKASGLAARFLSRHSTMR